MRRARRHCVWAAPALFGIACNAVLGNESPVMIDPPGSQAGGDGGAPASNGGSRGGSVALGGESGAGSGRGESGAGGDGGAAGTPAAPVAGAAGTESSGGSAGAPSTALAPEVVSVSPKSDLVDIEPDISVTIRFSEEVDAATVSADTIGLYDGRLRVPATLDHSGDSVLLSPEVPLDLLATYVVRVSTDVTDLEGTPLEAEFESSFTIRDGEWSSGTVITNRSGAFQLEAGFPPPPVIDARGNAMLVWPQMKTGADVFSIWARRYLAREGWTQAFEVDQTDVDCSSPSVAMNSRGDAVIAWVETPDPTIPDSRRVRARRFIDGELETSAEFADPGGVPGFYRLDTAATETGVFHVFWTHSPVSVPAVTSIAHSSAPSQGKWTVSTGPLTSKWELVDGPSVGFAADGSGLAIWSGAAQTGSAVLSVNHISTDGSWSGESQIPGTTGATLKAPALAVAANGDAVIVWTNRDVFANRYVAGEGWTSSTLLERADGDPVLGSSGVTFAGSSVLATFAQTFTPIESGWACTYADGAWAEPELISDGTSRVIFDGRVGVGADRRGNALALMIQQPEEFQTHDVIFARRPAASGEWSTPGFVTTASGFYRNGLVKVAANGTAVASWVEGDAIATFNAAIFE